MKHGLVRVTSNRPKRRLVMSVEGPEKTGKSTLIYSAPAPIALINMDEGDEGVVEKWADTKIIYKKDFAITAGCTQEDWEAMWNDCKTTMESLLRDPEIKTIGLDTGTEAWELIRLARFGALTKGGGGSVPLWYGPVNREFSEWIRLVYRTDKNLIITHKIKDEYVNDKRTGKIERDGFKQIPYIVQCNIVTWRRADPDTAAKLTGIPVGGTFGLTIRDCRQNAEIAGMELEGDMCNFAYLASMVFEDTSPDDWE